MALIALVDNNLVFMANLEVKTLKRTDDGYCLYLHLQRDTFYLKTLLTCNM